MIKEDPKKVAKRVKKHHQKHKIFKLQMDITPEIKEKFKMIPGDSYIEKFKELLYAYFLEKMPEAPTPVSASKVTPERIKILSDYQKKIESKVYDNKIMYQSGYIKEKRVIKKHWLDSLEKEPNLRENLERLNKIVHADFKNWLLKGFFSTSIRPEHISMLLGYENDLIRELVLKSVNMDLETALKKVTIVTEAKNE